MCHPYQLISYEVSKKKIKCILLRLNNTCKISNVEDVKLAFRQNGKTVSMWGLITFGTFSASSIKHLSRLSSSCALRLTFINCKNQILIIKIRPNNFETRKFFQKLDYGLEESTSTCMTPPLTCIMGGIRSLNCPMSWGELSLADRKAVMAFTASACTSGFSVSFKHLDNICLMTSK